MPYLYIVVGSLLMMYPMTLIIRMHNRQSKGKAFVYALLIVTIALFGFFLGAMMLVLGAEILQGTVPNVL